LGSPIADTDQLKSRGLGAGDRQVIASALFHGSIQVSAVDQVDWMIAGLDWRPGP
jgi:hypothetical protein